MTKRKQRRLKKIHFAEWGDEPLHIRTNGVLMTYCCDCNLRHIYNFKIHREKNSDKDYVEIWCYRDQTSTELRRFYEKQRRSDDKKRVGRKNRKT